MIYSMTGYGIGNQENDNIEANVEIKSLNSKFTDIYLRIPKSHSELEIDIRSTVTAALERGKIEVTINIKQKNENVIGNSLNKVLIKKYYKELAEIASDLSLNINSIDLLSTATKLPSSSDLFISSETESIESDKAIINAAIDEAIKNCLEFRAQEGKNTENLFLTYINTIADLLEKVNIQDPIRTKNVKARLLKSIADWENKENFDKNRFEQELIYYVEKYDIAEETTRLKNHLDYFKKELNKDAKGKKLNFITQEIGREVNTIGSKANDSIVQKLVVEMKENLEKIKEQTMNIV